MKTSKFNMTIYLYIKTKTYKNKFISTLTYDWQIENDKFTFN